MSKCAEGSLGAIAAKLASFDEMRSYLGGFRGESGELLWIWTAVVEESSGDCWGAFEVGARDEATFLRMFDRLPDAGLYEPDAYAVYKWLPRNKHVVGKGGAVNRNEGLHSVLRSKVNSLVLRTKGYSKSVRTLESLLSLTFLERFGPYILA